MTMTSSARLGRAFVFTAFALGSTALTVALPSVAMADTKKSVTTETTFFAKRSQGRSTDTTAATVDPDAQVARSNGRGRGDADGQDVLDDMPVTLDYARADADRASGSNSRGRNNGSIADEVPSFDLADTTPEALDSAEPDSRAALMAAYQEAREALFAAAAHQDESYTAYVALRDLDAAVAAVQFPDGGHAAALEAAKASFAAARQDVMDKQAQTRQLLMEISGGKPLSDGAVRELHVLLGV